MPHYIPKPLQVTAIQYTGDNAEEINEKLSAIKLKRHDGKDAYYYFAGSSIRLCYKAGSRHCFNVDEGSYVIFDIRDHNGNISVIGEKEFEERYDRKND